MTFWRRLARLLPSVRRREDADIAAELEALRQMAAPGELGNLTAAGENAREAMGWVWFERVGQDIRYAVRSMAHDRVFATLVVVSLALGIGANTAIFSFMESILLRSLPVRDPQALVVMKWRAKNYTLATSGMSWSTDGSSHDSAGTWSSIFPFSALALFQHSDNVLSSAFGYVASNRLALTVAGITDAVKGQLVSGGYFAGMGVAPAAGRLIAQEDDVVGAPAIALLSERLAHARFGDVNSAIGAQVRVNDKPFTVVGVVPGAFYGAEPGAIPDVYMPLRADEILSPAQWTTQKYADDHLYWLEIMARLKPGISVAQAEAALAPQFRQFAESTAATADQVKDLPALTVQPGAAGLDNLRRQYTEPIAILMTMVGVILLIACANITNLLLSRAAARRREIAVRLSIGATRARIIRQLLTESVLLACVGGGAGVAVAWWGIGVLTNLLSNGRDNFTLHASLDTPVLAATAAIAVLTGVLVGLAPALRATRVEILPALKDVRGNDSAPRHRRRLGLGHALVIAQIVLSIVLLTGAGLFARTLGNLHAISLGFDRENVLLFLIRPGAVGYKGDALPQLYETIRTSLRQLPGVVDVTSSVGALPMGGGTMTTAAIVGSSTVPGSSGRPIAALVSVGPSFFHTMRIPIDGRDFTDRDRSGSSKVVVVNRRLAAQFGVDNPLGRTLKLGAKNELSIVGVVDDAPIFSLKEDLRPVAYLPYLQTDSPGGLVFEIRTAGDPIALAPAVRQVLRGIDSRLAVSDVKTQAAHIDQAISTEITLARLCTAFAALALAIACVGLYGTVAFNVARRTSEIGIRMTLGAMRGRILWMILRDVLIVTAIGLAAGTPLALAGSRLVKSLLYGVTASDPMTFAVAIVALAICALAAGMAPAWRASQINPLAAIRHE